MIKIYFDDIIPEYILNILEGYEFEMTTFEKSDILISCKSLKQKKFQELLNYYANIYKKIVIFLISDTLDVFNIPFNVTLFRTNLNKSKAKWNEYILPNILENNSFEIYKEMYKTNFPIIGYYGKKDKNNELLFNTLQNNDNTITNFIFENDKADKINKINKSEKIDIINKNNKVEIINKNDKVEIINKNEKNEKKIIEESHFYICNQNNIYKILSLGRIPIIKDNNIQLPFEEYIDWNHILIIHSDEKEITKKIKTWWVEKNIISIHERCRNIYNEYFIKNKYIEKILNKVLNHQFYPNDFDFNIYNKYNDLLKLNASDLLKHYIENGKKEERMYKLPDYFNVNLYRIKNDDLVNLNYDNLIKHYINFGYKENRPC